VRLDTLIEFAGIAGSGSGWEELRATEVSGVAYDSRTVEAGDLFVAIEGYDADGHDFIDEAAEAGAAAAVVRRMIESPLPQIVVPDPRLVLGRLAAAVHGYPGERLYTVGVTGTNGKTTTTHLIRHILEADGERAGVIGTIAHRVGGLDRPAAHTTPESADLQSMLAGMLAAGDASAVLEVSSHALVLGRVEGMAFDVTCFTNLGRDHLDFHPSMDDYLAAKQRLFTHYRKPGGTAVINIDDSAGARLARDAGDPVVRVAIGSEADVRAERVELLPDGIRFELHYGGDSAEVHSPLLGLFNVPNHLVAAGVGLAAGLGVERTAEALSSARQVPGRMERLPGPPGVAVVLDYAHKPEALRGALQACRELTDGRLIVVFGCGGDRDRGKRPLMGRIAALGADLTVVTSDNPRSEDPQAIIDEIVAGIPEDSAMLIEVDRRAAIALALDSAMTDDLVLVAGKGHEQYQILASGRVPFDEREVVAAATAVTAEGRRA